MSAAAAAAARHRRPRLLAVLLLALAALVLLPAAPAAAHAVLVSSDPADGARVERAPTAVRLVFDEAVTLPPQATAVLSSTGVRVDRGAARQDGDAVVVPLRADVPEGVYSVSWRVVSADSHVVTGSIRFGIRRDADAVGGPVTTGSPLDGASAAAAGLLYLGLAAGVGVPAAAALFWPSVRRRRRVVRTAAAGSGLAALATVADLLLRGPRSAGAGWPGVLALDDLGYTLTSAQGAVLLARLVLLVLAGVLLARRGAVLRTVVGVLVLITVALLGHATDGAAALLLPAAVLHLAAMALWLGGLLVLVLAVLPRLRRRPATALRVLRRWSVAAFVCIGVLVVTGEVQAFPVVAPIDSLWATDYGRLLLVKLLLVVALIAAAAASQRIVARAIRPAARRLRAVVAVEVVGVVAVLGVTGAITGSATAAETYGPPVTRTVAIGADRLVVDVASTRRGTAVIRVRAVHGGSPVRLQTLSGAVGSADVAALDVDFRRRGDGWQSTDATLPVAGTWTLTLQAQLSTATAYAADVSWPVW
ncbi:copper resistance CopC family protein [Amnibacterium kyonggiense]